MAFHRRNSTHAPGPCGCGATHTGFACDAAPADGTGAFGEVAQEAVVRAAFPQAATRRALINVLGAGTLFAALDSVFPLAGAREALAQASGAPEKRDLKIGFIPITCATPTPSDIASGMGESICAASYSRAMDLSRITAHPAVRMTSTFRPLRL